MGSLSLYCHLWFKKLMLVYSSMDAEGDFVVVVVAQISHLY